MRLLRDVCVLLCITEHSHLLSLLLHNIPVLIQVMHTAGANSQICLVCLHPSRCLAKIFKCQHMSLDKKKKNHFLNTYLSSGIIRGASKQSQGYSLCSFLGLLDNSVLSSNQH